MSKLTECISNNSHTKDGTLISGHILVAKCAVIDEGTGRTYFYGECENCGKIDVSWTDKESREIKYHPQVIKLGGYLG